MAKKVQKKLPRRKEEFTYHGYKIDELREMSLQDLLPVMPSYARRKVNRGWTIGEEKLLSDIRGGDSRIRTH